MIRTLAFIILFILLLFVLYKIIKSILKVVIIGIIIIIVSLGAFGFMFYNDMKDMRSFGNASNLFVLRDKGLVLSAFQMQNGTEPFQAKTPDELKGIENSLTAKDTKDLETAHGRVFVFNLAYFEGLPDKVEITDDMTFSRAEMIDMLRTGEIPGYDGEDMRAAVFFASVVKTVEEQGLGYTLEQYRAKNLEVYPQTILFSVVRWTPNFILKPLISRV